MKTDYPTEAQISYGEPDKIIEYYNYLRKFIWSSEYHNTTGF